MLSARGRRRADALLLAVATLPRFWLGVMLVLVFHTWAGWLPASHAAAPGAAARFDLAHLVLPALALALPAAAAIARVQRAAMDDPEAAPRLALARAAGVPAGRVLWRHRVRPALAPVAALAALDLPLLLSGAVVVESVFAWPGAGRMAADAVMGGDYPLALAATMLAAASVVLGGIVLDAVLARLDPRMREAA
jgi:ABC-type dipeptide/oligopeptide/nickel transport system permease component